MSYRINHYNGSLISVVNDGTIDKTLDITLVGKNYAGYGAVQNENFTYLLENFASVTQPPRPVAGQLWYDSGNKKIKVYDGSKFRTGGVTEISATQPTGLTIGDFWWDTVNNQLHAYTGSSFALIGPQIVAGAGTTEMVATTVLDDQGATHSIIQAIAAGETVFIISSGADVDASTKSFTLNSANPIPGFTTIHQGITLAYTNNDNPDTEGITQSNHRFWGTSSDADRLGGLTLDNFVQKGEASFNTTVSFAHAGFTVGRDIPILKVYDVGSITPYISNIANESIVFTDIDTVNNSTKYPLTLWKSNLLPGGTLKTVGSQYADSGAQLYFSNAVNNIGADFAQFNAVYATNFIGIATKSDTLKVNNSYYSADDGTTNSGVVASTIVARTSAGDIYANIVHGTATNATLAATATNADNLKVGSSYYQATVASQYNTIAVRDANRAITADSFIGTATNATLADNATHAVTSDKADTLKVGSSYVSSSTGVLPNTVAIRDGSSDLYASTFHGTATNATVAVTANKADSFKVGSLYRTADVSATGDTFVVRDGSADIFGNIFHGTATTAEYADLAEKYLPDAEYEIGTVVCVGGEAEVTACNWGDRAIGIVSENPAFKMNSELEGGTYIALKGRVPCKVVGAIKKGQRLIAANDGTAMAAVPHANDVFAIALGSSDDTGVKVIEVLVL
jgi:hypothetical protein